MENTPSFNLSEAVRCWREKLAQSPRVRFEDLSKMESQLLDSVANLRNKNISEEEAFLVAARRLGSPDLVEKDSGNTERVWLERSAWILIGYLLFSFIFAVAWTGSMTVSIVTRYIPRDDPMQFASRAMSWLLGAFLLCFLWRQYSNNSARLTKLAQLTERHPYRAMALFLFVMWALGVLQFSASSGHVQWMELCTPAILSIPYIFLFAGLLYSRRRISRVDGKSLV